MKNKTRFRFLISLIPWNLQKFSILLLILLFSILNLNSLSSQTAKGVSKHGAPFLRVSPYARQVSMGNAASGLADDIGTMRYNIGGLGSLPNAMGAFHFHKWIDDTQQGAVMGAIPTRLGILGIDFSYFNEGSLIEMDQNFSPTGKRIDNTDIALTLGYGRFFALMDSGLSLGASLKMVRQNFADEVANAVGMDFGGVFYSRYFSLGLAIQNLGITKLQFKTNRETLPETYRGGLGVRIPAAGLLKFNLATDIAYVTSQNLRYYAGAEMVLGNLLAVRGGYKFHDWEASRWSTGFGLLIPMDWLAGSETRLDYAYSPLDAFESTIHRFSLIFSFGAIKRKFKSLSYEEERLVRRIYEEKREATRMNEELERELEAAKKARKAIEETEQRTRLLEEEMKRKLEQIQKIAQNSKGKIEVIPQTDKKIKMVLRINFDFDSAIIRADEYTTMKQAAEILNTYPTSQVQIAGHTDNIGTEQYNIRLSERRVQSVMSFLANQEESVSDNRFYMPIGYGEMKPIATNRTKEGRFKNRRVDFDLYTQDAKPEIPTASAVREVKMVDDSIVHIICNGKASFLHHTISNPDRIVIDLSNIYLLFDMQDVIFNRGPFLRARMAFHPNTRYTRVVLDLRHSVKYTIESVDNYIKIEVK